MPPATALFGKLRVGEWVADTEGLRGRHPAEASCRETRPLPGWRWNEDRWRRGLAALSDYFAHTNADAVDHVEIDGLRARALVRRCRDDYRSGSLQPGQIDDLESLPGWTWRGPDERWRQGFAALRAYYLRYGSARPPQKTVIDGFALGPWVHDCRRDYQLGTLSPDRVAELESLPTWAWSVKRWSGKDWTVGPRR